MFKKFTGKWPNEAGIESVPPRNVWHLPATEVFHRFVEK
jgi:hypothetical protein